MARPVNLAVTFVEVKNDPRLRGIPVTGATTSRIKTKRADVVEISRRRLTLTRVSIKKVRKRFGLANDEDESCRPSNDGETLFASN